MVLCLSKDYGVRLWEASAVFHTSGTPLFGAGMFLNHSLSSAIGHCEQNKQELIVQAGDGLEL